MSKPIKSRVFELYTKEQERTQQLLKQRNELLEALQLLVDNGFQITSNKDMDKAKKAIEKALK